MVWVPKVMVEVVMVMVEVMVVMVDAKSRARPKVPQG